MIAIAVGPPIGVAVTGREFVAVIHEVARRRAERTMLVAPAKVMVFCAKPPMDFGAAETGVGRLAKMTICARGWTRMGRFAAEAPGGSPCWRTAEAPWRARSRRAAEASGRLLLYAAWRRSARRGRRCSRWRRSRGLAFARLCINAATQR